MNRRKQAAEFTSSAILLFDASPVYACFSGYYAPAFLDLSDTTIAAGVITMVVAVVLALTRRGFGTAIAMLFAFLALSYYGHWMYGGDCGAQIVQLNRYALVLASIWFGAEAWMLLHRRSKYSI